MRAASVLLLFGIYALSASIPHSTFRYQLHTSMRRTEDCCRLCYGDDCINLDDARCQYYASADEILDKAEDDGEVTEIDGMMYDLTEQAAMSWTVKQCVPLISRYTDCTKENVCIGCNICTCTSAGEWACSVVSQCRPDANVDVDHRTLVMVMEELMEGHKTTRKKRSANNVTDKVAVEPVRFMDIAEWMYGVKPNTNEDIQLNDVETDNFIKALVDQTDSFLTQTQPTIHLSKTTEPENIDFEEVLRNIASNDQNNKRWKSQLKDYNNTAYDYMDLENNKVMSSNASDQFIQLLNDMEEGKDVTGSVDDAIVNTMPRDNYYNDDINATDIMVSIMDKEEKNAIDANDVILDKIHIMKRDVSSVTNLNNTTQAASSILADIILDTVNILKTESLVTDLNNTTKPTSMPTASFETTTNKFNDIENNVLIPLTSIIDEKIDEIKQLLQIRENLVKFIKIYNYTGANVLSTPEIINSSSTYFSIYKLDLFPEIQENLRSTNPNVLEKMLYKLKRDIYEVLRDITKIQKFSKTNGLPADLKILIRTMKYYVHEQGNFHNLKKKNIGIEIRNNTRRILSSPTSIAMGTANSINKQLFDILEVLDKDKVHSNALAPLSKSITKIMKRVIKQHYVDDFSNVGLRVYDPSYNLTDDLRTIGKNWPEFTAYVASSPLYDNLYAMKLLHFSLAEDINRITDAISMVEFAHSRRMTPLETPVAVQLMERVNSGLILLKTKIDILLKHQAQSTKSNIKATRKKKKYSFFDKLRKLLKNSKKEVIALVNNDVPKSEIVRRIAEKKLDELTLKKMSTYEQTMLKWQRHLKTARRKKRHLDSQLNNIKQLSKIKNIIPKYLQGKINPALVKKRISKKAFRHYEEE